MSKFIGLALSLFLGATALVLAEDTPAPNAVKPDAKADAYPLTICVVSGEDLGNEPASIVHEGRTIKLCCNGCAKKFKADPAKYLKILDEAEKAEKTKEEKEKEKEKEKK